MDEGSYDEAEVYLKRGCLVPGQESQHAKRAMQVLVDKTRVLTLTLTLTLMEVLVAKKRVVGMVNSVGATFHAKASFLQEPNPHINPPHHYEPSY